MSNVKQEKSLECSTQILQSPRNNIYWFARVLIASDKYRDIGTDATSMLQIAAAVHVVLTRLSRETDEVITAVLMDAIRNILCKHWERAKKSEIAEALCEDLSERLLTPRDFQALAFVCERVMLPIAHMLEDIPINDGFMAESAAEASLKVEGEAGLFTVINLWSAPQGSYSDEIVQPFGLLRKHLAELGFTEVEENLILTAFCQEFERRVGQKRILSR